MGKDIYYLPKVAENTYPTPFKLVRNNPHKLVFERPEHDFPQRIEYQIMEDGSLQATISDMERKKEIPFIFNKN